MDHLPPNPGRPVYVPAPDPIHVYSPPGSNPLVVEPSRIVHRPANVPVDGSLAGNKWIKVMDRREKKASRVANVGQQRLPPHHTQGCSIHQPARHPYSAYQNRADIKK